MIKSLFRQNSIFIALSLLLALSMGLALILVPKGELHLFLCDRHTDARDIFYKWYTRVGEWAPYLICVLLLFYRFGYAAIATACLALSALTTQILKHLINAPRPVTWFQMNMPDVQLPLVEGVEMNLWYSFPSGHTTSFFALFFALCVIINMHLRNSVLPPHSGNNKVCTLKSTAIQLLCFILAALGGYSRIYLSQHFTADVLAGLIVGMGITALIFVLFTPYKEKKWYKMHFFEKK